jgi:hypothetical protein
VKADGKHSTVVSVLYLSHLSCFQLGRLLTVATDHGCRRDVLDGKNDKELE